LISSRSCFGISLGPSGVQVISASETAYEHTESNSI
jgi:hypothetical protein